MLYSSDLIQAFTDSYVSNRINMDAGRHTLCAKHHGKRNRERPDGRTRYRRFGNGARHTNGYCYQH